MNDVPTLSGNEITDITRRTNTQGDGLLPEQGSTGIWEATTNLVTNGGFETGTTGWGTFGGSISRITTNKKFGSACLQGITATGSSSGPSSPNVSVTGGATYTGSAWVLLPTGEPFVIRLNDGVGFSSSSYTGTGEWQYVTHTRTVDVTATVCGIHILKSGFPIITILADGVQLEQQPLATPYVETDGASATRAIASAVAPASVLDETQTWVAFRVRMSFDPTADLYAGGYPTLMEWGDDANNKLYMGFAVDADQFYIQRRTISGVGAGFAGAYTFAAGSILTVIGRFTATEIAISINGAAFVSTANILIPTLAATSFRILDTLAANRTFDGDIFWFTTGTGTLTDADAKRIASFNNSPQITEFPGAPTWFWGGAHSPQGSVPMGEIGMGRT